jgi:hypothetical protein
MHFSTSLGECLEETISATKGAIQAACEKRERQQDTVSEEMRKMKARVEELENLEFRMMEDERT